MSWLKDYFSFTRKERNAFIVLVVLIAFFLYLPEFFSPKPVSVPLSATIRNEAGKSTGGTDPGTSVNRTESWQTADDEKRNLRLFYFNPNTLDEDGFISLGLPPRTARTIINYRSKGGQFRKPEDLRKIYTLKPEDADRIIPWARIPGTNLEYYRRDPVPTWREKAARVQPIDINKATAEEWKSLPGIGEVLSARITRFRESIHGFHSIEQVGKTYGLPDSTFQSIKKFLVFSPPPVTRMNINTAGVEDLMDIPGITRNIANAIIEERTKRKQFTSLEDLKNIPAVSGTLFGQISPYLKIQ